jgi:hypothetical protein
MRTPFELQVTAAFPKKNIATFSLGINSTRILGVSVPIIAPRDCPVTLFSVVLPEDKTPVLIFFGCAVKSVDSASFLKINYLENRWNVRLDVVQTFPYEMFVVGNDITVQLSRGLVSTSRLSGAYKVTHDALCKLLIGNITEKELFAEEMLFRRLCGIEDEPQGLLGPPKVLAK